MTVYREGENIIGSDGAVLAKVGRDIYPHKEIEIGDLLKPDGSLPYPYELMPDELIKVLDENGLSPF